MPGEAERLPLFIDQHETALVALCQKIPRVLQGVLERQSVIAGLPNFGELLDALLFGHAKARGLLRLVLAHLLAGKFGLLLAVAFRVLAGYEFLPEFQLHALAGAFVGGVIVAVGDKLHVVDVGALPNDMKVGPVVLAGVEDDGARLILKPQLLAENVGGPLPLLGRHGAWRIAARG